MKKFVVERNIPGASNLTTEELEAFSKISDDVIETMNKPYTWIQSFITDDKIYCVHLAESEKDIREHSKLGRFPINIVSEIKIIFVPATASAS